MNDFLDTVVKYSLSLIGISIPALALWQKWVPKTDRLFEKYSKLSSFAFDLSKKTGDKALKKISKEYGYAAITRENKLTHEERRILLKMVNPINGIEEYHKCSDHLKIDTAGNCFNWKEKRHNNQYYRCFLYSVFFAIYIVGSVMFFSPVFYPILQQTFIGIAFQKFPLEKKFWASAFIIVYGAIFFFTSLNKLGKLSRSRDLIKNSLLPRN